MTSLLDQTVVDCLNSGGIVVAKTDTIYGILARAADEHAVERVFRLKRRGDHKSPIVLIANYDQPLVPIPKQQYELSRTVWPGPVTIAIPVDPTTAPQWLSRGNQEFGHRMPADDQLATLISRTGPLIAPSANPEGETPAINVHAAIEYFGDQVDVYVDGGEVIDDTPSQLLRINESGDVERLR